MGECAPGKPKYGHCAIGQGDGDQASDKAPDHAFAGEIGKVAHAHESRVHLEAVSNGQATEHNDSAGELRGDE